MVLTNLRKNTYLGVVFFYVDGQTYRHGNASSHYSVLKALKHFPSARETAGFSVVSCLLSLDVAPVSNVISLKGRKTVAVRFNLFWKDRNV